MYRPKDTQERIIHRFKISLGHLEKIVKMVQEQKYCIDILHQSQAVQKALSETDRVILENHLKTCVAEAICKGKKDLVINELMNVFEKRG
jgi:DNA-binding FrmR family transcriptional regulator